MAYLLRSVPTSTKTAIGAFALYSSSYNQNQNQNPKTLSFPSHYSTLSSSFRSPSRLGLAKNLVQPPSAATMEAHHSDNSPTSQNGEALPQLLTEYMVDMKCEGCVNSVKNKLQTVDGVKNVEVDLTIQVVRVLGSTPVKTMTEALEQTGRKARLIGQGIPDEFLVSAAVAEFKGPVICGVVRFAQLNMELARIEANFSGLTAGKHAWSINEYGDLTKGAASTGNLYNPTNHGTEEPLGDLRTLDVDEKGEAFFSGVKQKLRVPDLIGRSVVVYGTEDIDQIQVSPPQSLPEVPESERTTKNSALVTGLPYGNQAITILLPANFSTVCFNDIEMPQVIVTVVLYFYF